LDSWCNQKARSFTQRIRRQRRQNYKPGALRKELGVKEGKTIPAKKLAAAAKKPGTLGKRARLAETLKGLKKK